MNSIAKNKWWAIAFVVLIIMNISTITVIWLMHNDDRRIPGNQKGGGSGYYLSKQLGFDSVQKQKLLEILKNNQEQLKDARGKIRDAKDAFFELLKVNDVSDSLIQHTSLQAALQDQAIDIISFKNFQQIRSLCTPEQKIKFDGLIKEIIHSIGPPPKEPRQPPPPPDGDRPPRDIEKNGPPPPPPLQ